MSKKRASHPTPKSIAAQEPTQPYESDGGIWVNNRGLRILAYRRDDEHAAARAEAIRRLEPVNAKRLDAGLEPLSASPMSPGPGPELCVIPPGISWIPIGETEPRVRQSIATLAATEFCQLDILGPDGPMGLPERDAIAAVSRCTSAHARRTWGALEKRPRVLAAMGKAVEDNAAVRAEKRAEVEFKIPGIGGDNVSR